MSRGTGQKTQVPVSPGARASPTVTNGARYRAGGTTRIIPFTTRAAGQDVTAEVKRCAEMSGLYEYTIIFSTEELKRVPAVRVGENGGELQ